jgi:propionyl-CoA carboxylase alpha chain
VRVEAQQGDPVRAGQVLVVLEAMKMEHQVRAPLNGRLAKLGVSVGEAVDQGTVLAVVDSSDSDDSTGGAAARDGSGSADGTGERA